jgi:hypothetical protein
VASVKKLLEEKEVTMVRTIPYTLEFSPVEIFIN